MSAFKLTFYDKDGAVSIPEIVASLHAAANLGAILLVFATFIRDVWIHDKAPDYVSFATAGAALVASVSINVAALGAAQRMRDGVCKTDGDEK